MPSSTSIGALAAGFGVVEGLTNFGLAGVLTKLLVGNQVEYKLVAGKDGRRRAVDVWIV